MRPHLPNSGSHKPGRANKLSLHRLRELGDKGEENLGYQQPTHLSSPLYVIPSLWLTLTHSRPLPVSQVLICEYPNRFMIEH